MHPLDVVKTRLQVQKAGAVGNYTSVADCFSKIIRNEGSIIRLLNDIVSNNFFFSSRFFAIYKGIIPPILAETPKRATKFFTFEQYRKLFMFGGTQNTSYVS